MFIGMVEAGQAFVRGGNFRLRRVPPHVEEAVVLVILLLLIPTIIYRDEDSEFFSTDPDPTQLKKNSGSDLKSKWKKKYIYILGR